ncbi:MAG: sigma-70 family RNA polymerase sigma factor [Gemmatimonadales bacterium]|nr:sigma-70 family RNA polymerase sigma factor [Gemmatimonadales bacterium]
MEPGAIEGVFRREHGRILAGLVRQLGSLDLAEDALQDAYMKALAAWPAAGIPERPAAWLTTVARRRAIDLVRRERGTSLEAVAEPEAPAAPDPADDPALDSGIADERLRLVFTCCHPAINQPAQVALTLRTLCGLTTREIARAFVEPEATTAQRIVRAKRKIAEARIPYEVPASAELPARLAAVLEVVYLIFNEGYAATEGERWMREEVAAEALRLGEALAGLLPREPEVLGLVALMRLHHARRAARLDADGAIVPLEAQDRARWDRDAIAVGAAELDRALALGRPGPYQVQAAIAALHARAPAPEATDWRQIALLYGALAVHQPTPVVALNRAVAIAFAEGLDAGLAAVDAVAADGRLDDYHLLHAARADLLRRLGRRDEAAAAFTRALALARHPAEQRFLARRLADVTAGGAALNGGAGGGSISA